MTLDHIEQKPIAVFDSGENMITIASLLDLVIKNCDLELEEHIEKSRDIIFQIECIDAKLIKQRQRQSDRRELLAINLGEDELNVKVISIGESMVEASLCAQVRELEAAYTDEIRLIEQCRVIKIRCIEALEQRFYEHRID